MTEGQIFDTCCISPTRISAPKSLTVVVNTNTLFGNEQHIFLELRYVSVRYGKSQKLDFEY